MREDIYDLETFPNAFLAGFLPVDGSQGRIFEISDRRRQNSALWNYVARLERMVGFNNMAFDWPVLDYFMRNSDCSAADLYAVAMAIIGNDDRNASVIWRPEIPQVDLFRVHHFDNPARATSLKKLEFNMRSELVQNLPFENGTCLSWDEIDVLMGYNAHDLRQTLKFWHISKPMLDLREAINPDWINQSDTGLGRKFFERRLTERGIYLQKGGTFRPDGVSLGEVIFPYLQFKTPVLQEARALMSRVHVVDVIQEDGKSKRLVTLDGKPFKNYSFEFAGLTVTMGIGGLHAGMESVILTDCDIEDIDATSFYPSVSIVNRIYPEHLGESFCDDYGNLKTERLKFPKGTPENEILKKALNSVFGSGGSDYTVFYDLKYFLGTTINGQLLLLSLTELLLTIPGLKIVQINTDGITIIIPEGERPLVKRLCDLWAKSTRIDLEFNTYSKMWLRDVNNYIAEYKATGKRKRKGCYEPERGWHQNQSYPIIRRAAEACMCDGANIEDFISANDSCGWDFMLRLDLSRESHVLLDNETKMYGVVRYYVSETGHSARKVMANTESKIHARGHAEASKDPVVWTCQDCGKTFATKAKWAEHVKEVGHDKKTTTVLKKAAAWTCSACGAEFPTKKAWEEHADATHASKITLAQEYHGEPIDYDMRFYASEARKLVINESV
jgi:hypothetical protein